MACKKEDENTAPKMNFSRSMSILPAQVAAGVTTGPICIVLLDHVILEVIIPLRRISSRQLGQTTGKVAQERRISSLGRFALIRGSVGWSIVIWQTKNQHEIELQVLF